MGQTLPASAFSLILDTTDRVPVMAPAETDEIHAIAARRLSADGGQRYTTSRRAIIDVLMASHDPMTLPEILICDRSLAQSSAYRNLTELIAAGVVHRIVTSEEHAHFELAQDLTGHHHHLICTMCGRVTDFVVPEALERQIDSDLAEIARSHGFRTEQHQLDLIGRCRGCA